MGRAAAAAQGHPSPPQALPTAFEAEKRSDGRSVTGSCLGTPPSIDRAVPYLFARDPSTKVVVSVSRDGSHYRAIGKGATLEMKLLLAVVHKPRLSDKEPWSCLQTGREGAGHRPPAFCRGGILHSVWADLSSFPRGKHLWDSPGYSWSPQVSLSGRLQAMVPGETSKGLRALRFLLLLHPCPGPHQSRAQPVLSCTPAAAQLCQWEQRGGEREPSSIGQLIPLVHPFSQAQRL